MSILALTRNRAIRRTLGLLSLSFLTGGALEPVAHSYLVSTAASPAVDRAEASAPESGTHNPYHDLDCTLCHAAGSVVLPGIAVKMDAPIGHVAPVEGPSPRHLSSVPFEHAQARAPPAFLS